MTASSLSDRLAAILREHRYQDSALAPCLGLFGGAKREQIIALLKEAQLMMKTCCSANGYMTVHDFDAYQRYCEQFSELCGLPEDRRNVMEQMRRDGYSIAAIASRFRWSEARVSALLDGNLAAYHRSRFQDNASGRRATGCR